MNVLSDLDGLTWVILFAALLVSAVVLALDVRDWRAKYPILSRGKRILLWGFAAVCVIVGAGTIEDASDARHFYCSGFPFVVKVRQGSRSGDTWLVRVSSGGTAKSPLLALHDPKAILAFREHKRGLPIIFGYLNEPHYDKSGLPEFKVVDMAYENENPTPFYHFDTRSHPYRVAVLFGSALLLFLTELINNRLADARPDTEDDYENYRDLPDSQASDLTSLRLTGSSERDAEQR